MSPALVQFLKGHSIAEAYSRVDGGKLSEKEMSIFLQGNSGGKEWIKDPRKLAWERTRPSRKGVVPNALGTTDLAYPGEVVAAISFFAFAIEGATSYANIR